MVYALVYDHSQNNTQKNVDILLRLRIPRYWGEPILLKRVNVHAKRRELSTFVLDCFFLIPQLLETRIKSGRSLQAKRAELELILYVLYHLFFRFPPQKY